MSFESPAERLLLSPKSAAAALAISPRKLWSLTASGDVPCVRIGRSVRYDAADLADFVETLKVAK
jgi:excisionase family DNA binding protein